MTGSAPAQVRPVVAFKPVPDLLDAQTVYFDNRSSGVGKFEWDFGDGTPINDQDFDPTHRYALSDVYTVTLTALPIGSSEAIIISRTLFVQSSNLPPAPLPNPLSAQFRWLANPQNPFEIEFRNDSLGDIVSWSWQFGDGTNQAVTDKAPFTHVYSQSGIFPVTLIAVEKGTGNIDKSVMSITVAPAAPAPSRAADFAAEQVNEGAIHFIDTSTGEPGWWHWDFGDGDSSDVQHPFHQYAEAGNYLVLLLVSAAPGEEVYGINHVLRLWGDETDTPVDDDGDNELDTPVDDNGDDELDIPVDDETDTPVGTAGGQNETDDTTGEIILVPVEPEILVIAETPGLVEIVDLDVGIPGVPDNPRSVDEIVDNPRLPRRRR